MIAVPFPTAVTKPPVETVAMNEFDVAHVTVGLAIRVPPASFTVAVSVAVSGNDVKLTVVGDNSTLDGVCATVTTAAAVPEPETAMMTPVPFPTAVTKPEAVTVAMVGVVEVHVTDAPETTLPPGSFTVATIVAVSSIDERVREVSDSSTLDVTCPTVTEAAAFTEPEVAMIVAVPFEAAVTNPAAETVATVVSDDAQVTEGLAIALSFASFTRAVSVAVSPNDTRIRVVGDNVTELGT